MRPAPFADQVGHRHAPADRLSAHLPVIMDRHEHGEPPSQPIELPRVHTHWPVRPRRSVRECRELVRRVPHPKTLWVTFDTVAERNRFRAIADHLRKHDETLGLEILRDFMALFDIVIPGDDTEGEL